MPKEMNIRQMDQPKTKMKMNATEICPILQRNRKLIIELLYILARHTHFLVMAHNMM
jgi:hypothetical protein